MKMEAQFKIFKMQKKSFKRKVYSNIGLSQGTRKVSHKKI